MYDGGSAGLLLLPRDAQLIVVGSPGEAARLRPRYSHARFLLLDHDGTHPGYDILDFEKLYVSDPQIARRWAIGHWQAKGAAPLIYANPHNYQRIAPVLAGIGWHWWAVDQTGSEHAYQPPPGWKTPAVTQWFGSRQPTWRHYDISLVTDDSWLQPAGTAPAVQPAGGSSAMPAQSPNFPVPPPGGNLPWWVVYWSEPQGGRGAVPLTGHAIVQAADRAGAINAASVPAHANITNVNGPFATQAQAQNDVNQSTVTGSKPHGQPNFSFPNPLSGLAAIGDFFSRLGQASTWIRVAEVLIGAALIIVGLAKLTGAGKIAIQAGKIAAKTGLAAA